MKKKLVVLTGAGMSVESGIPNELDPNVFGDRTIPDIANADNFETHPEELFHLCNVIRAMAVKARPNKAHKILVELENDFDINIITQNVDELHEIAGSKNVMHIFGNVMENCEMNHKENVYPVDYSNPVLNWGDKTENGELLRPNVILFDEAVPNITKAVEIAQEADIFAVIGTSLQVDPAASLLHYVKEGTPIYYIDPYPADKDVPNLTVITKPATEGVADLAEILKKDYL